MIVLTCSTCGQRLELAEDLAGKEITCPSCRLTILVPSPSLQPLSSVAAKIPLPSGSRSHLPAPPPDGHATPSNAADAPEAETLPPTPPRDYKAGLPETLAAEGVAPGTPPELTDFLAPAQAPDELGRLGPYRVLQVLGAGGMGVVFLAEDPSLQRKVALKALLPTLAVSASARQRFLREARAAAALDNDHIVHLYQVGEDRGVPFLAMQLLRGEPLENRLRREPRLPTAEVLRIGREIAQGLAAAHDQGLIHRDIKPANIWLETPSPSAISGTGGRVKILDFGLARATAGDVHLTQSGAIMGTPAYMAPEQAGKTVDHRADLFSLGCVLYRMATGELPFPAADTITTLIAVATQQPRAPREINPGLPPALERLILQLLAKEPSARPQTARAVAEAIQSIEAAGARSNWEGVASKLVGGLRSTFERLQQRRATPTTTPQPPRPPTLPPPPLPLPPVSLPPAWPPAALRRPRQRSWFRRVLLLLIVLFAFWKIMAANFKQPVVIQATDPAEEFTLKLGDKSILEFRATAVPKLARKAAESYLKTRYRHWSITSQALADKDHAVFRGTFQTADEHGSFRLRLIKDESKNRWEFDRLDTDDSEE